MSTSTLDKISKILNLAENASTEAEAAAYMDRALKLSISSAIDLEMARQHTQKKEQRSVPEQRVVRIVAADPNRKRKANNSQECVGLATKIADAYSVKTDIFRTQDRVIFFGLSDDIDRVEMLLGSLLVQMKMSADKRIANKEHFPNDARPWRTSFYESFIIEISRRLKEAKKNALQDSNGSGAEMVIRGKELEVDDFYGRTSEAKGTVTWRQRDYVHSGWQSGSEDGKKARLGVEKQIANRGAVSQ